jgi:hypothetical protein
MHSACVPCPTPMASGRAILAPPLLPLARLGHIGATAQRCSPLGGGGKERLRKIVEEFFFRRGRQGETAARHLLVRSPPGLGKTKEAMEWATRYQAEQDAAPLLEICLDDVTEGGAIAQTAVFVPRHALALEIKEVIESNPRSTREARGGSDPTTGLRTRKSSGNLCPRWRPNLKSELSGTPASSR